MWVWKKKLEVNLKYVIPSYVKNLKSAFFVFITLPLKINTKLLSPLFQFKFEEF